VRGFLLAAFLPAALLLAGGSLAEEGLASWYGGKFQGRRTASGEIFDTRQLTAAHKSLPFGTRVLVTNLENGQSVTVRINDRGPFVAGRVIDLSLAAAAAIGLTGKGVAPVRLEVLGAGAGDAEGADHADGVRPAAAASAVPASYRLQIGSFRLRANAAGTLARLQAAGFAGELEPAAGGVTRVVIRGVPSSELARLQQRLAAAGWAEALVRAEP
jgi:rare lipoprotein A